MRSSNPLVSVVIPAYNEEKYLPACLEALSRQTFRDFEVVVVDNNSTDRTAEIARSLGARVVHEENAVLKKQKVRLLRVRMRIRLFR